MMFIQMEIANERGNAEMPLHVEIFMAFENGFDGSKYKENVALCS